MDLGGLQSAGDSGDPSPHHLHHRLSLGPGAKLDGGPRSASEYTARTEWGGWTQEPVGSGNRR